MRLLLVSGNRRFDHLKPLVRKVARQLARLTHQKSSFVEVFLVDEAFMYKNVLSFPAPKDFPRPEIKEKPLGEIYLNPDYIKKNGEDLVFMLVHGFLHLLGYDHKKNSDRILMEKKEKQLLKSLDR